MDITVAEEQVFQLLSTLDMEKAREKAWDKKTAVFGTGLGAIFSRPKAEEVQLTYSECRYEPFWHVACHVRYVFDRARSYSIPVSSPEVKRVTIEGVEHQVTAKPRQFTTTGIEHCVEEASTEVVFDAVSGQERDWKNYLRFGKEPVPDLNQSPLQILSDIFDVNKLSARDLILHLLTISLLFSQSSPFLRQVSPSPRRSFA